MIYPFRHSVLFVSTVLFSLVALALPAFANTQSGVIGLYNAADPVRFDEAVSETEAALSSQGCAVARVGEVVGVQADIGLAVANRLIHIICRSPLLDDSAGRLALNGLSDVAVPVALVEGRYLEGPMIERNVIGRAYILKLSRYSNSDLAARDADLAALGATVAGLDDAYRNEAFIEVHRAAGMPTPDEAVLLSYDTPEAGERFRNNNQSLLERIGLFNQAHLTAFAYYVVKPLR
ncbi:hypothetical protein RHODOSMS8_01863 [Rhodobiaceae bacterium]|nr:hypothetical protein RHODOSMS8_01863 [Rhodobiaceae bacterium]